ncbi:hypothetical protein TREES_T100005171 [Tupaia chinensis]|uniref:Uncharacterized protein n=1 Tax=Tupaia chinensis TaxID=246437 RepID=L9L5Z2_TUPCH|nr:hypothetical protein TREES_T100005171 [Tupaia chinensis]
MPRSLPASSRASEGSSETRNPTVLVGVCKGPLASPAQELPSFQVPPSPAIPGYDKINIVDQRASDESNSNDNYVTSSLFLLAVMLLEAMWGDEGGNLSPDSREAGEYEVPNPQGKNQVQNEGSQQLQPQSYLEYFFPVNVCPVREGEAAGKRSHHLSLPNLSEAVTGWSYE